VRKAVLNLAVSTRNVARRQAVAAKKKAAPGFATVESDSAAQGT